MDVSAAFGDVSVAVAFVGLMAFLVSVITEGLKRIKWIEERIPTAITVIVLSLVLCPTSLIALFAWMKQPIEWEEVFASFLAAFVVALWQWMAGKRSGNWLTGRSRKGRSKMRWIM